MQRIRICKLSFVNYKRNTRCESTRDVYILIRKTAKVFARKAPLRDNNSFAGLRLAALAVSLMQDIAKHYKPLGRNAARGAVRQDECFANQPFCPPLGYGHRLLHVPYDLAHAALARAFRTT